MAKITTITNPLTGQPAQVDQLDHTAQQIDDGLNIARGVSNPNLLDNWYFGNPINQRGQTSYTGAGYGIDRWYGEGILIEPNGLTLTAQGKYIFQNLDDKLKEALDGKTVTASALLSTGELLFGTKVYAAAPSANEYFAIGTIQIVNNTNGSIMFWASQNATIVAVKLELGDQQTLAHKDENENWVLNEIPDYGEQLARCQRYFQLYSSADIRPANAVDCRPVMRAEPSQDTIVIGSTTYYYNTAEL